MEVFESNLLKIICNIYIHTCVLLRIVSFNRPRGRDAVWITADGAAAWRRILPARSGRTAIDSAMQLPHSSQHSRPGELLRRCDRPRAHFDYKSFGNSQNCKSRLAMRIVEAIVIHCRTFEDFEACHYSIQRTLADSVRDARLHAEAQSPPAEKRLLLSLMICAPAILMDNI